MKSLLTKTRLPDISFYKSGRIDITSRLAKVLGLKGGDLIDVSVEGREIYLHKRSEEVKYGNHAAQCRSTHKHVRTCNNLRVYHKQLANIILSYAGVTDAAKLPVGEPVTINGCYAVPIIYKNNLNK